MAIGVAVEAVFDPHDDADARFPVHWKPQAEGAT